VHNEQLAKDEVRRRVWRLLAERGAGIGDVVDRIPNFVGSEKAADRLGALPAWDAARTVKANPDQAQESARRLALVGGKLLFMAVPRLAEPEPFYRLDPADLGADPGRAADRYVAAELTSTVGLAEMPPIDFVVCGSVAVNYEGVRIGKGAGYSDIELALLADAGLLRPDTTIVTTVHELQVLDEPLPSDDHDFTVDYVLTPERTIACHRHHRPSGIDRRLVTAEMQEAIPVLRSPTK
jgi:5-formyltetrahydrofolate cyclo-ligase